ncbi:MAG: hypothetical protein R3277_00320 [Brumimicrobium sp.]|nr:hypothetical protein [Brumimicrobium sp.]
MKKLSNLSLIIIILMTLSCSAVKETSTEENSTPVQVEENEGNELNYDILKKEVLDGAGEEGIKQGVIKIDNNQDFVALVNKMNSVNDEVKTEELIRNVHFFKDHVLLFVFDEVRGSRGYELKIGDITEYSEKIQVNVNIQSPQGPSAEVMSQPYMILQIPLTDKPVVSNFNEQ